MIEIVVGWTVSILGKLGYSGILIMMALESACIPIPSEAILPFGGYLASSGNPNEPLSLFWVIFWGTAGGTLGSVVAYYVGAFGGRALIDTYAKKLRLSDSHLKESSKLFRKHGDKIIFYSRLIPIVRTFISLPAGISKMNIKKFIILTYMGSMIWSILLAYAGYTLGQNWDMIRSWLHFADYAVILAGIAAILYYFRKKIKKHEKDMVP